MTEIELYVNKTAVGVSRSGILTTGMVGVPVSFAFDHSWDGLVKTAVFKGGMTERDRILDGTLNTTVPAECLLEAGSALRIGVEGRSTDGELVIPTIWGFVDTIQSGAKASGKPGEPLEHPAWAQVMDLIGDMSGLSTENKETLVAAINEAFSRPGGGSGIPGTPGKSAYEYALEAGYAGTEEEFAAKLAEELPAALPNPHALTINGQSYDGSEPVEVTIGGSSGGVGEFCITVTDKDTGGYAIDKTVAEITEAFVAGKLLYCKYGDTRVPLVKAVPTTVSSGVRYDEWYFMAVTDDATSTKVLIKATYRGTALRSTTVTLTTTNYLIDAGKEDGLFAFQVLGNDVDGYTLSLLTGSACTAADIFGAVLDGRSCLCYYTEANAAMPFVGISGNYYAFGTTVDVGDGVANVSVLIGSDGSIAVSMNNLSGGTGGDVEIPEKLPNPNSLTIGGVAYDGSKAVTIESLKNPNPLTINGQPYDGSESVDITVDGGSGGLVTFQCGDNGDGTIATDSENLFIDCTVALGEGKSVELGLMISTSETSTEQLMFRTCKYEVALVDGMEDVVIVFSHEEAGATHLIKLYMDGTNAYEVIEGSSGGSDAETEMVLSDNLFDKASATFGGVFYYSGSGLQLVDSDYDYYAYVPLRGAGTYRTKLNRGQHASTGARIALVKEDNSWFQSITGTLTESADKQDNLEFVVTQQMIDNGAAKIAFDCYSEYLNKVMIVKDREYPENYIPYGYIEVSTDNGRKQKNVLCEKTAVFLGDSICAGTTVEGEYYNYGWAGLIGEPNRMNWTNYGMNGGTITSLPGVQNTRWLTTQADKALSEHPAAHYVIFEGGCNDADQMKDALLGTISSDYATFDTDTFSGAFEALVLKLVTSFPTAKIGYIIPQKMYAQNDHTTAGHVHRRYFDRAIEICEKWGIPYVDLWKSNPLNPKLSTASTFYTDGQHLTLAGYQRITPQIEAFMRSL